MSLDAISGIIGASGVTGGDGISSAEIDMKRISQIITANDADKDRSLSISESTFSDELFQAMDKNGDDKLSSMELFDGIRVFQARSKNIEHLLRSSGASGIGQERGMDKLAGQAAPLLQAGTELFKGLDLKNMDFKNLDFKDLAQKFQSQLNSSK